MKLIFEITPDELPVFLAETDEQLQLLDEGLLQLEKEGESTELLQALFRGAHTLKGTAWMIAHNRLVSLTHALETAFDGLRLASYPPTPKLIDLCFETVDALRLLREEVVYGVPCDIDMENLTDRFSEWLSKPESHNEGQADNAGSHVPDISRAEGEGVVIEASIAPNSIASAARAYQIMLALQEMGKITYMNPGKAAIDTAKPIKTFTAIVKTDKPIEEIKKELALVSEIDKLSVEKREKAAPAATSAVPKPPQRSGSTHTSEKTIRTSVDRLDNLMRLIGELITNRNQLHQIRTTYETHFQGSEEAETLTQTIAHISHITDQLQTEVMGIRMVPIATIFNKFPRMVRDLAKILNKQVDLVIEGNETEVDRSLVELIYDPIIHLLRNAIDHGIELPEERRKAGKPERGQVLLSARYDQGHIIITIDDDGSGIDPVKLRVKAVQKGFVTESEANTLSDEEATNLIFNSGFSTTSMVSNVSGRGVGLDIVRNNIKRLNGNIILESWPGKGTHFEIMLPATMMIIQTLLVRVGDERLAVPLPSVVSTLGINEYEVHTAKGKPVIILKDKTLPILPISDTFGYTSFSDNNGSGAEYDKSVVVVAAGKRQIGLLVDQLIGEEEVVIKSLGPLIGKINGISSAAILADGRVILIVDVQDLFKMAGVSQHR